MSPVVAEIGDEAHLGGTGRRERDANSGQRPKRHKSSEHAPYNSTPHPVLPIIPTVTTAIADPASSRQTNATHDILRLIERWTLRSAPEQVNPVVVAACPPDGRERPVKVSAELIGGVADFGERCGWSSVGWRHRAIHRAVLTKGQLVASNRPTSNEYFHTSAQWLAAIHRGRAHLMRREAAAMLGVT